MLLIPWRTCRTCPLLKHAKLLSHHARNKHANLNTWKWVSSLIVERLGLLTSLLGRSLNTIWVCLGCKLSLAVSYVCL